MNSIRRELLWRLLAGLAITVAVAGAATYYQAREEANELFDYQLRQMAYSVRNDGAVALPKPRESDVEEDFVIQVFEANGLLAFQSPRVAPVPRQPSTGFIDVTTSEGRWRVYTVRGPARQVQVAQPLSIREELAAGMALRTVAPLLVVLPLLGALILLTVRRGLRPLLDVTGAVRKRGAAALAPLPEAGLPEEVRPLVHALNDLLGRLGRAMATQKAFIADAAHELRTPLTAIQLQLDEARSANDANERNAAFDDLQRGLARAIHLVGQLLTLARQEPDTSARAWEPVDLSEIARLVVAEHAPLAAARQIDLGIGEATPFVIQGDPEALRVMLGNLVDNAVRYAPSGSSVDVGVARRGHNVVLTVEDAGPGIPADDQDRIFDRFARGRSSDANGSGLGLAIVKSIADRHLATVALAAGSQGHGLCVVVSFPT
ncbi:MAG: ATP-binding protein [Casimicrobiaceae bacterium]